MKEIIERIHSMVWGAPALLLIIGIGLYLSVRTGFLQLRFLPRAFGHLIKQLRQTSNDARGTSGYQALCTALAATVGTGNIAGVAGAICIGGPGSIFWMWICGILGMVIKYAEATLAVYYRKRGADGQWIGGPMYMIREGLGNRWKWLAVVYSVLGLVASFGVGNATQVNALLGSLDSALASAGGNMSFTTRVWLSVALAILVGLMLTGGAKRIGAVAEQLVPAASIVYILMCVSAIALNGSRITDTLRAIVLGAFSPQAVTGGVLGSAFHGLRVGVARGVFTNEAGMGTASIAHAAAEVDHPAQQGLMGIMEVFLDTMVICTLTALAILCSGIPIPYGTDMGAELTSEAFSSIFGSWSAFLLSGALCCFAFATIMGWGLYGMRCAQYLFGHDASRLFGVLQGIMVIVGAMGSTATVWSICEIFNGLMVIPNLIALILLSPRLLLLTREYENRCGKRAG